MEVMRFELSEAFINEHEQRRIDSVKKLKAIAHG